jgi:acyl-CoA reductase-like NAD-dependent aldehyde dehydrogenase
LKSSNQVEIISPISQQVVAERVLATKEDVIAATKLASQAQLSWANTTIQQRAQYCHQAIDYMLTNKDELAKEITLMMGRPLCYSTGEINGLAERARFMIDAAEAELEDICIESSTEFKRFIRRQPLGVVATLAPWNYPYLTTVNSIIPALMAGNAVILKHSMQTLLCAERFAQAFQAAELPEGVFQYLHIEHDLTRELIRQPNVNFVSFTGSVTGGEAIEASLAGLFKGVALELGGKDPAYVRADADLDYVVAQVADGAFFNSGQSCCGIERVYVDQSIYQEFTEKLVELVKQYQLGDPLNPATTLGPLVNVTAAERVRTQISQAISEGATAHIKPELFAANKPQSAYLAPQVLTNVNHNMSVMTEESFGPVVGVMSVENDKQAIELMNDSVFGLTASIWSSNETQSMRIAEQIETGTVFLNRCDYLDPALAWVGIKQSGKGCALSRLGYQQLTRPKSFHFKLTTG